MNLSSEEYNPYYKLYIDGTTKANSIVESLTTNLESVVDFYRNLPKDKLEFAYADGKWTPKEILLHIIDTERIFAYRAMRIARQDRTELAGFEQDDYVASSKANNRSLDTLLNEYVSVRHSSISLFKSFNDLELQSIGKASGSAISVRAIGYILTGHENHHNRIIKERYL
ncbi:DinB family protein [Winogradskyella litorisediminis]|uniref:DinB family protein n=1 Tax=Winogradskyella litorisediminis TaxID=1156618 RepID=A0ABW3N5D5_9FLAO